VDSALAGLVSDGATVVHEVTDVGDGIRLAAVREPGGGILGVIENPQFELSTPAVSGEGPGR
jgi:predicted enzyme related to lactoylglutathione lyase